MTDSINTLELIRKIGPEGRSFGAQIQSKRNELTYELQKYMHVLGPTPKRCLETLADLGLTDPEIGRYLKVPTDIVTKLRQVWTIDGQT
jgi:hypothetical protein